MGIGFSHGRASWSYSGFNRFRARLAAEIGIELDKMRGFGGLRNGEPPGDRPWDDVVDDIVPLINHSDCDGELSPEECRRVAPRLRELVKGWPTDFPGSYDVEMALALADGMDEAAAEGVPLGFC